MSDAIKNYRNMVEQPWGKMFYELIYRQLNVSNDQRLKILDFGAGFCITADHYAEFHNVIALEPNEEMRSLRAENNKYDLIGEGVDYLSTLDDGSFDLVICHNVLEYATEREEILRQLVRVTKQGGELSIVKHNLYGRVMASAVLSDDPMTALSLLNQETEDSFFGKRDVYGNDWLISVIGDGMRLAETYAIRTFFGLSSNNGIKYTDDWYRDMLELETRTCSMEEFRNVAFFNHLIFKKDREVR